MTELSQEIIMREFVPGRSRTKGSLRPIVDWARRTVRLIEDHPHSAPWRKTVIRRATRFIKAHPYTGPVRVDLVFVFEREIGKNGDVWPSHDTPFPTALDIGDLDKLERNILDAIGRQRKSGPGIIDDDRWVSSMASRKRWGPTCGVWIVIRPDTLDENESVPW